MNKEEALTMKEEILAACPSLTEKNVELIPPQANSTKAHGYTIRIQIILNPKDLECIKNIADKHHLSTEQTKSSLSIFRPCFLHSQT